MRNLLNKVWEGHKRLNRDSFWYGFATVLVIAILTVPWVLKFFITYIVWCFS